MESVFHIQDDLVSSRRLLWLFLLVALLFHFIVMYSGVLDLNLKQAAPRVEVSQIDPKQLEQIKKQWKNQQFLLDKDNIKEDSEAPKDARYFSKRNRIVEKEQKSKNLDNTPRQAQPAQPSQPSLKQLAPKMDLSPSGKVAGASKDLTKDVAQSAAKKEPRPFIPSADQFVSDKLLPEGSENLLNTERSVYYSFFARMKEVVEPVWLSEARSAAQSGRAFPLEEYITLVDLILNQDGSLKKLVILKSAGVNEFDEAVQNTFKRVTRIPHPPKGLVDKNREVHISFSFQVNTSTSALPFQPGMKVSPPGRNPNWN